MDEEFYNNVQALPDPDRQKVLGAMSDDDRKKFDFMESAKQPAKPNEFYEDILKLPPEEEAKVTGAMDAQHVDSYNVYKQLQAEKRTKAAPPPDPLGHPETVAPRLRANPDENPTPLGARIFTDNFKPHPEDAAAYLAKTHPELEVKLENLDAIPADTRRASPGAFGGGAFGPSAAGLFGGEQEQVPGTGRAPGPRVMVRDKTNPNAQWHFMNPETGFHPIDDPAEAAKDTLGILYPAAAGIGQGFATAAGGIAGGMATPAVPGLGARVGAAGAGGLAAGGADVLRQLIGNLGGWALGGPLQEFRPGDSLSQAGWGALAPLIVGSSATPAAVAKAGAAKGLQIPEIQALTKAQKGIPAQVGNWGAEKLGSFASGIPMRDIQQAKMLLPQIRAIEKQGGPGLISLATDAQQQVRVALPTARQKLGEEIGNAIDTAGQKVDVRGAKKALQETLHDLRTMNPEGFVEGREKQLTDAERAYNMTFRRTPTPEAAQQIHGLEKVLQENEAKIAELETKPGSPRVKMQQDRDVIAPLRVQSQRAKAALDLLEQEHFGEMPDFVDGNTAMRLKRDLQDLSNFSTGGGGLGRYRGMATPDIESQAKASKALGAITESINKATESYDSSLGLKGTKSLNAKYKDLVNIERSVPFLMGNSAADEKNTFNFLRNLSSPSNLPMRQRLLDIDKQFHTSIVPNADILNSSKLFSDPSITALSGWGATSTSRSMKAGMLGSMLGTAVGGLADISPAIAGPLGGMAAMSMASPAGLRAAMNLGDLYGRGSGFVQRPFGLNLHYQPALMNPNVWEDTK